jgi:hypothetical protein
LQFAQFFEWGVVRDQSAVDVVLAHAPRNELAVLRAEI